MSDSQATEVRRVKVEPGIWKRTTARGGEVFEVTWRDAGGRQRRQKVAGGLTVARKELRAKQGQRDRGERHTVNTRLRFGDAAERWRESRTRKQPATQIVDSQMIGRHLRPRFGNRRMDQITTDDAARLVESMRAAGYAENTTARALCTLNQIFKFAARRLGGPHNPVAGLLTDERPKTKPGKKRIYRGDELADTLRAAGDPWRTLFLLAVVTGGRQSELLGLRWSDVDGGAVKISGQVDRHGNRVEHTKNTHGRREVPLPEQAVAMLASFRAERTVDGFNTAQSAYLFSTRTGRPIGQREAMRALRRSLTAATTADGRPTFPVLHEGRKVERGEVPDFHAFRHQFVSQMVAAGWTVEQVADHIGDVPLTVQTTYRQEIKDAARKRQQTAEIAAEFARVLG